MITKDKFYILYEKKSAETIKYKAKEKNGIYALQIRRKKTEKKDALFIISRRSEKGERKRGMMEDYAHIYLEYIT